MPRQTAIIVTGILSALATGHFDCKFANLVRSRLYLSADKSLISNQASVVIGWHRVRFESSHGSRTVMSKRSIQTLPRDSKELGHDRQETAGRWNCRNRDDVYRELEDSHCRSAARACRWPPSRTAGIGTVLITTRIPRSTCRAHLSLPRRSCRAFTTAGPTGAAECMLVGRASACVSDAARSIRW